MSNAEPDISQRYGFEPAPASVKLLNEMFLKRGDHIEVLGQIVAKDPALANRLLRAANPRAKSPEDYQITTTEDALHRVGLRFAFLLAMSDPLICAVNKTFRTMLSVELSPGTPKDLSGFEHILGAVTFDGKTPGNIQLRLPRSSVVLFGERMLGLKADETHEPGMADDLIGEICNIVAGNFKSNLCDAGFECKLHPPHVSRTSEFRRQIVDGGVSERYGFVSEEITFFADLSVKP